MRGQGLVLDAITANAHVGTWLRDVANVRLHAETKSRPDERFVDELPYLLPRGPAWQSLAPAIPANLRDIKVPQHDLSVYDAVGGLV